MNDVTRILKRHEANPLLDTKDFPNVAQFFNPSPVRYKDEVILLAPVVTHDAEGMGRDVGQTRIARSKDGIHFTVDEENWIQFDPDEFPFHTFRRQIIDNRVTQIGDTYYILTPVMSYEWDSPVAVLGKTTDFVHYEKIEIVSMPKNRGASLFPEKINGKYWKLDRPGGGDGGTGEIWISSSPDLIHWGCFRPVLLAGYRFWNMQKIGPTPPIKTEHGWLDIIHGVFSPAGGTYYYIGAILLDLEEPWKVIGKTNGYLLKPEMPYELHGNCDTTDFPCGAIPKHDQDELWLYYGATDQYVCLATGCLSEIVTACVEGW